MMIFTEAVSMFFMGVLVSMTVLFLLFFRAFSDMNYVKEMLRKATSEGYYEKEYVEELWDKIDKHEACIEKWEEIDKKNKERIEVWVQRCDALETKLAVQEANELKNTPEYIRCMIKEKFDEYMEGQNGQNKN